MTKVLLVEYNNPDASNARFPRLSAGLGCKVSVKDGKATILDVYDEKMKLFARQGENNSYTIACDDEKSISENILLVCLFFY